MTSDNTNKDPLYEKLQEDIDHADWSLLQSHYDRGAVFLIKEEIDLIEVGIAMAKDDVDKIKEWMANQSLSSPTEENVEAWKDDLETRFQFLIIQPYVLIQIKRDS